MSTSLPGWIIGHPTSGKVAYLNQVISLNCLARDQGLSTKPPTAIGRSRQVKEKGARSRDGSSGQKARGSSIHFGTSRSRRDQGDSYRALTSTPRYRVKVSTRQPQSQPWLSLASTRVHLVACKPPHRQLHKVSEVYSTKSEYPSNSRSSGNQWRGGIT